MSVDHGYLLRLGIDNDGVDTEMDHPALYYVLDIWNIR